MQFRKKTLKPADRLIDRVVPAPPPAPPGDVATRSPWSPSPPRLLSVPSGFQLDLFALRSPLSRLAPARWEPVGQTVRAGRSGASGRTGYEPGTGPSPGSSVLRLVLGEAGEVSGPREVLVRQPDGPGTPLAITTQAERGPRGAEGRHGGETGEVSDAALSVLQQMLRLDEDYELFYRLAAQDPELDWAPACDGARVLRSATAFEDLVKCLLLGAAKEARAAALCEALCALGPQVPSDPSGPGDPSGSGGPGGRRAFPGPAELAACSVEDLAAMGAGRLARPLHRLAALCASGTLHAEALRRPPARLALALDEALAKEGEGEEGGHWDDLVHEELEWQERVRALLEWLPGFGERAVGEMLLLLGCYEDVQLHPAALRRFGRRSPRRAPQRSRSSKPARPGAPDPDRARADSYRLEVQRLLRRFERYGLYRGLAQALLGAAAPRA